MANTIYEQVEINKKQLITNTADIDIIKQVGGIEIGAFDTTNNIPDAKYGFDTDGQPIIQSVDGKILKLGEDLLELNDRVIKGVSEGIDNKDALNKNQIENLIADAINNLPAQIESYSKIETDNLLSLKLNSESVTENNDGTFNKASIYFVNSLITGLHEVVCEVALLDTDGESVINRTRNIVKYDSNQNRYQIQGVKGNQNMIDVLSNTDLTSKFYVDNIINSLVSGSDYMIAGTDNEISETVSTTPFYASPELKIQFKENVAVYNQNNGITTANSDGIVFCLFWIQFEQIGTNDLSVIFTAEKNTVEQDTYELVLDLSGGIDSNGASGILCIDNVAENDDLRFSAETSNGTIEMNNLVMLQIFSPSKIELNEAIKTMDNCVDGRFKIPSKVYLKNLKKILK